MFGAQQLTGKEKITQTIDLLKSILYFQDNYEELVKKLPICEKTREGKFLLKNDFAVPQADGNINSIIKPQEIEEKITETINSIHQQSTGLLKPSNAEKAFKEKAFRLEVTRTIQNHYDDVVKDLPISKENSAIYTLSSVAHLDGDGNVIDIVSKELVIKLLEFYMQDIIISWSKCQ